MSARPKITSTDIECYDRTMDQKPGRSRLDLKKYAKDVAILDNTIEQELGLGGELPPQQPRSQVQPPGKNILDILKGPTGPGAIDDYIDHPMNFNKSQEVAQLLRGFTGLAGDLKLAIIDIVFGIGRMIMRGRTSDTSKSA